MKCRVAIPKSAAASLEALANFALDGDEASAAALAPEDMDLVRGDDCGEEAELIDFQSRNLTAEKLEKLPCL